MLTITQEFMLLAVKPNKRIASTSRLRLSIVTVGLMDLALKQVIEFEKKKVVVIKELPEELMYLSSLYDVITRKEMMKLSKISEIYSYKNKEFKQLRNDIENSLENLPESVKNKEAIIERMRSEFLEDELKDETVVLAAVLNKNKELKKYFSAHEMTSIRNKIKELKKEESNQVLSTMINNIDAINVAVLSSAVIIN